MTFLRRGSLRTRTVVYFSVGSLSVALLFALSTYLLADRYLLGQRTAAVEHRALADAEVVTAKVANGSGRLDEVLRGLDPLTGYAVLVHDGDAWHASTPLAQTAVPELVKRGATDGQATSTVTTLHGRRVVVAGVPLPGGAGQLYEVAPLDQFGRTMTVLTLILAAGVVLATLFGGALAVWASNRLLVPLNALTATAAQIAGGDVDLRLDETHDPDLATLVGAFNSMVDALQARIERDARFASDVSHELRTPLATLVASIDVLQARRSALPERQQEALDLAEGELSRFRRLLDDLIELARIDAGVMDDAGDQVDIHRLLQEVMVGSDRSLDLLHGGSGCFVRSGKRQLERIFGNLLDNADRHGRGLSGVWIEPQPNSVVVRVDDCGPGVPCADRERVFDRFATAGGHRGSAEGTGLGLAIAMETATALGGQIWVDDAHSTGARFCVRLPRCHPGDADGPESGDDVITRD
jgi:two-component system, OmpR family, sensor histidine kinase MtrB